MVILMVPLFALGIRLLRRRSLFVRELVFSFHFHAMLLLLVIALALITALLTRLHPPLTPVLSTEATFVLVVLTACVTFLTLAFRTAYGDSWLAAIVRGLTGFVVLTLVLTVYRAVLFFVVFWAIG